MKLHWVLQWRLAQWASLIKFEFYLHLLLYFVTTPTPIRNVPTWWWRSPALITWEHPVVWRESNSNISASVSLFQVISKWGAFWTLWGCWNGDKEDWGSHRHVLRPFVHATTLLLLTPAASCTFYTRLEATQNWKGGSVLPLLNLSRRRRSPHVSLWGSAEPSKDGGPWGGIVLQDPLWLLMPYYWMTTCPACLPAQQFVSSVSVCFLHWLSICTKCHSLNTFLRTLHWVHWLCLHARSSSAVHPSVYVQLGLFPQFVNF